MPKSKTTRMARKGRKGTAVSPGAAAGLMVGQEVLNMRPLHQEPSWRNVPIGPRDRTPARITYSSYIALTTAAGAGVFQAVSGNSPNDPDATGGGGQPTWFDQFAAFYYYYRCWRSTIEARVFANSNSPGAIDVVMFPDVNNTISEATIQECRRLKYCKSKIVQPSNGGNNVATLNSEMDTGTMFGQRQIADDGYAALCSANPTDRWYWLIGIQDAGGATSALAHTIEYTITYFLTFEDMIMEPGDSSMRMERALTRLRQRPTTRPIAASAASEVVPTCTVTQSGPRVTQQVVGPREQRAAAQLAALGALRI